MWEGVQAWLLNGSAQLQTRRGVIFSYRAAAWQGNQGKGLCPQLPGDAGSQDHTPGKAGNSSWAETAQPGEGWQTRCADTRLSCLDICRAKSSVYSRTVQRRGAQIGWPTWCLTAKPNATSRTANGGCALMPASSMMSCRGPHQSHTIHRLRPSAASARELTCRGSSDL